jgi:nicotinate phosphoribosyltransferase
MRLVEPANAAMLTDLYELTMAASYFGRAMNELATFELFIRSLPAERNFLVAAGLEDALDYLESFHFSEDGLGYLSTLGLFDEAFLGYLRDFRFTGDVWAMAEGEAVFPQEPLLRVTAPLIEAQFVETFLLNCISYQTMVTSKAARISIACEGRAFVDFSPRRDHGADAALKAARASFIGGADATSNVLAGQLFGIPVSGTMAHSYVMSFGREIDAFRQYAADFPGQATLLLDTYDTIEGAQNAVVVGRELAANGETLHGVRLDSGDMDALSREVRAMLDAAGLRDTQIFASGDLDEHKIGALLSAGAPIDAFGVGTQLGTSADAPALGAVYKLVENTSGPRMKRSTGKATLPGTKQVYRVERGGTFEHDTIALAEEPAMEGRPLLEPVMRGGRRTGPSPLLPAVRDRTAVSVRALPAHLRALDGPRTPYPVGISAGIQALIQGGAHG